MTPAICVHVFITIGILVIIVFLGNTLPTVVKNSNPTNPAGEI